MTYLSLASGWRKYLWLAAGIGIGLFATNSEWSIPIAGWLFSIGLLRFARSTGVLTGFACVAAASTATSAILVAAAGQLAVLPLAVGCAISSVLLSIPLLLDRLLFQRLNPIAATLVFPAARVAMEYLIAAISPLGTVFGPLAATQSANLSLLQLVSVTGSYGISFLMAWVAPVVNLALERHWSRPARTALAALASVLALVLVGGGLRLAFAPETSELVRIAGISVSRAAEDRMRAIDNFHTSRVPPERKSVLRRAFAVLDDDLFAQSRIEADSGAEIVVWPEAAAVVFEEDFPDFLRRAQDLARDKRIHLDMGIAIILDGQPHSRDIAVLVAPDGQVLSTYDKAHPVPGMESLRAGDGIVPVSRTPYGRLANVICFDADFPGTMRTGADIMFVPANDWKGIERTHSANAVFRAVENGYTLVRQTSNGIAITVDPYGVPLARTDYFATARQTMVVSVPTRGTWTVYGVVGDLFAWICVAGVVGAVGAGAFRRIGQRG